LAHQLRTNFNRFQDAVDKADSEDAQCLFNAKFNFKLQKWQT